MKLLLVLLTSMIMLLNLGCGDSEHVKLSKDFVNALNGEDGYDVEIVKATTKQKNYILVRDYAEDGRIDAYDLRNYKKGDNISKYLSDDRNRNYRGIEFAYVDIIREYVHDPFHSSIHDPFGHNTIHGGYYETTREDIYRHPESGLYFSKVRMSSADLTKALELVDAIRIRKATDKLMIDFDLEPKRAKKIARLGVQLSKEDPSKMTIFHYDEYSKAILGNTFSDIQVAMKADLNGDKKALDSIYEDAAKLNKISVPRVKELSYLFIKN